MQTGVLLQTYRREVELIYTDFFTTWEDRAKRAGNIPREMIRKFANLFPKGKLFRGALTVLGYELAGDKKDQDILRASLLVEVLHTALLIADDVFDNDDLRRGEPAVHKQWEKHFTSMSAETQKTQGQNMAFNTTIVGLYLAPLVFEGTKFSPETKLTALSYFFKKSIQTGWGEALDIVSPYQTLEKKRAQSQKIHDYKTVEYSGVLPLHLGALLAGKTDQNWLAKLDEYGECLGRIFQIQDDIIGSFGNKTVTGKADDGDIRQAKWTMLLDILFETAESSELTQVKALLEKDSRSEEDIVFIKSIMAKYGIVEKAKTMAEDYLKKGLALISEITQDKEYQDTMENTLGFMLEREK